LWYHDHAIHRTARNVYQGLAASYIVQDDLELGLPLPKGDYDVSLLIQDIILSPNGSLIYDDDGQDSLMGDIITVNGVPWPNMKVEQRKYRFRVLNGSLSRSYRLALSNGSQFTMIGTDAGLMGSPVNVTNFRIGMAERYEFVIDFAKFPIGTKIVLQNLSLPNNEDYTNTNKVMQFDVVARQGTDDSSVPSTLRPYSVIPTSSAVRTREFRYERSNGLWVINGKIWDPKRIDANPQLGDVEIWRLYNNSGGWFHPIHVHLIDAQIIDRNGKPPFPYERGFKDVFYVGENESVRVIGKFGPHTGKYMSHCHNSVHEDHDMMNQFQVGTGGPDPVTTAPARPLPAPAL
jgi:FtsP/CotA-like multicopper oxidase with cupredoxin domain